MMQAPARIVLALAVCATSAFAGPLSFSFTSSILNAQIGQTVTFSATLTNTGATLLFLNSDSVSILPPLILNDVPFFLNFPAALSAGQSITAPILDVSIPSGSALGLHIGSMDILGGSGPNDFTSQASQTFAVNVVPEAGSLALVAAGLAAVLRKRHFASLAALRGARPTAPYTLPWASTPTPSAPPCIIPNQM